MEPVWTEAVRLAIHLAMGLGLAACAGLRAFLPLLAVGLAGRLGVVPLAEPYAWLAGASALVVFGVAVAVEVAGDKVPLVDHLLDAFQTVVKPIAGALLMATAVSDVAPLYTTVLWIVAGGAIAGIVHLAKAKLRLLSTAATAGTANPLLSASEDVGALAGSALSIAVPLLVLALLAAAAALGGFLLCRRVRQGRAEPQSAP